MTLRNRNTLWAIFLGAVAIRCCYDIALYAVMGRNGLMGADSYGYLAGAQEMADKALNGTLQGWAWLGTDLGVMPLYPWFVAMNVALFGSLAPITTVLMQALVDGGTCLFVYLIAQSIDPRIAKPAAIAAAINPTQVVLSGLIYTDTLFVFFVAMFLYGAVRWIREPSWQSTLLLSAGLGLAAMARIVVVPWAPVLAIILLATWVVIGRLRPQHIIQMAVAAAVLCACIAPVLSRNVIVYNAWSLTPQGGAHLALWVAPLVREGKDGTPWEKGSAQIRSLAEPRLAATNDPFVSSNEYTKIGREELARLGVLSIAKAWAVGAAINLGVPAIAISPPIAQLPRTGFYATQGHSIVEKIVKFLFFSDNSLYAWALLSGIAGIAIWRITQTIGAISLVFSRQALPQVLILFLWAGFILAANGPIASPKYRLPIEPVLCVLMGAGVHAFSIRWKAHRPVRPDHTSA